MLLDLIELRGNWRGKAFMEFDGLHPFDVGITAAASLD